MMIGALALVMQKALESCSSTDPWQQNSFWRMNQSSHCKVSLDKDGDEQVFDIAIESIDTSQGQISIEASVQHDNDILECSAVLT